MIKFTTRFLAVESVPVTVVEFEIDGGVCTPQDLKVMTPPAVNGESIVVISGRGPVWLFVTLAHFYHPTKAVACFDPRLGAVITQTHNPAFSVGDVVTVS